MSFILAIHKCHFQMLYSYLFHSYNFLIFIRMILFIIHFRIQVMYYYHYFAIHGLYSCSNSKITILHVKTIKAMSIFKYEYHQISQDFSFYFIQNFLHFIYLHNHFSKFIFQYYYLLSRNDSFKLQNFKIKNFDYSKAAKEVDFIYYLRYFHFPTNLRIIFEYLIKIIFMIYLQYFHNSNSHYSQDFLADINF